MSINIGAKWAKRLEMGEGGLRLKALTAYSVLKAKRAMHVTASPVRKFASVCGREGFSRRGGRDEHDAVVRQLSCTPDKVK